MDLISYQSLTLPRSQEALRAPDRLSHRMTEALALYDLINGRSYSDFDPIPFGRAVELLDEFDGQSSTIAIDRQERRTVGIVNYSVEPQRNQSWVTGLAVDRDYHRLGIARNLLSHVERSADMGFIALRATKSALPFYEHLGYKIVKNGSQPVMRKALE